MRKIIIDTDCGSDDAVALMLALNDESLDIKGITTVCGNVDVFKATLNTLMTLEICKKNIPVYRGCEKPLFKELITADSVHGEDGMGDMNLIHPSNTCEKEHGVDKLIEIIEENPNEIEIITLGPLTNIAMAFMKRPDIKSKIKHIYSMATAGFGVGNTTPVSEFNVYVDAEAFDLVLSSKVPITIIGYDMCTGEAALNEKEVEALKSCNSEMAQFAYNCCRLLLEYNIKRNGGFFLDLPDPIAMAVALWPEIVIEAPSCYCYTCTKEEMLYGQVVPYIKDELTIKSRFDYEAENAVVIKKINTKLLKEKMMNVLLS